MKPDINFADGPAGLYPIPAPKTDRFCRSSSDLTFRKLEREPGWIAGQLALTDVCYRAFLSGASLAHNVTPRLQAKEAQVLANGNDLLSQMQDLTVRTMRILTKAERLGDPKLPLRLLAR